MARVAALSRTGPAHDPRADGRAARGCTRRAEMAFELAVQTAVDPGILGLAPHPLYVGRQTTRPKIATSPTDRLIDKLPYAPVRARNSSNASAFSRHSRPAAQDPDSDRNWRRARRREEHRRQATGS